MSFTFFQKNPFLKEQLEILLDIVIASVLCGIIGLERETIQKPAGFRTNMIIGGAATLLVSLGKILVENFENTATSGILRADPIRIIEAIVVGISFIGAGTILKQEGKTGVLYLTTAATILFTSGIGIAVALKQYILAIGVTLFVLIVNRILRLIEFKINIKKDD